MTSPDDTDAGPGISLDIAGAIGFSLSGIQDALDRLNGRADEDDRRAMVNLPRQIPLFAQATHAVGDAATTDLLDFGAPVAGRCWEVRLLLAFSSTFVVMATTTAAWYVGQKMAGYAAGILPPNMLRWIFTSLPGSEEFSGDQIKVLPRENLMMGLTGIPAAPTQISGLAIVDDMPLYTGRTVVQA